MKEEPVRGRLGCYKQYGAALPKEVEITATPSTGGIGDRDLIVADLLSDNYISPTTTTRSPQISAA
jgi:hypothetical protein